MNGKRTNRQRPIAFKQNGVIHTPRKKKLPQKLGELIFLLLFLTQTAQAFTIVCNGTPTAPLNVGVDEACNAVITTDMVLEDPGSSPGPKQLEARDQNNNLIATGLEEVIVPGQYLGQTIALTVIDLDNNNQCTGYLLLMDNIPPLFNNCNAIDVDAGCNADTHPDAIGYPDVEDNCSPVTLTWFDQMTGPNCAIAPPYIAFITRTWIATDNSGNTSQCVQTISLLRATLDDVVFPPNATVDCDDPETDPFFTGIPTINGNPIMNGGGYCEISTTFVDNIVYTCLPALHSYQIVRTWTVVDNCPPGGILSAQQVVTVADLDVPIVDCPAQVTANTDAAMCTGTVQLPIPNVTDNCTMAGNIDWQVTTSFGGVGFGPHANVPAGMHVINYTAFDECSNMYSCQTELLVIDSEPPTAICDEFTVASIPSTGLAVVPAGNLDDGSYDNCTDIDFEGSIDDGLNFSEYLYFDCEDVGQTIEVILRVFEVNNPAAYNDCVVFITINDKLPPVITCPPNQVVDCETNLFDFSQYGFPTVTDNCAFTVTNDSIVNLDQCGVGLIQRTFTATDPSGNEASCTQTLTVDNLTPFEGQNIGWPADYTLDDVCIELGELDPDDLPTSPINYAYPLLPSDDCALLAFNYTDQVFNIAYPACYKILRTWTVMDWCEFDPDNPGGGHIWTHTQVIKVNDYQMPELSVPDNISVSVGNNCEPVFVEVPPATATDCSQNISITNNSPFANAHGANASGFYPIGTTVVTYTAIDGCGNAKSASITITVEDNQNPTIICDSGISTNIANMGGGQFFVMVPADLFIAESYDNCTDDEDLEFFIGIADGDISGPPPTTELQFFCEDAGSYMVEIWTVDEAGNADFCITNLHIQDNSNVCPPMLTASIAGHIEDENGNPMEEVEVSISPNNGPDQSQIGSSYQFDNLLVGNDYSVTPFYNQNPGLGVTTYDLVLISRHILGLSLLNSPYKIIAADANGSGSVSTLDMVHIQKVILNLSDDFPAVNSWRFVDANWVFTDQTDPFLDNFPEVLNFNNLAGNEMAADFVAVKVGDVNGTAAQANLLSEYQLAEFLPIEVEDQELMAGEWLEIDFHAKDFREISALQFTLDFNPDWLNFEGVEACALPELDASNFGQHLLEQGKLTAAWYHPQPQSLEDGSCLFTLKFQAKTNAYLSECLHLTPEPTASLAYQTDGIGRGLRLEFAAATGVQLYQNHPNPFTQNTQIRFYLPQPEKATLSIYDLNGRVVHQRFGAFTAGEHVITLDGNMLEQEGIYYYKLETSTFSGVRRMIFVRG